MCVMLTTIRLCYACLSVWCLHTRCVGDVIVSMVLVLEGSL